MKRRAGRAGFTDLHGFARLDTAREQRKSVPEVVYCERKEVADAAAILAALVKRHGRALGTRASQALADRLAAAGIAVDFEPRSRTLVAGTKRAPVRGRVGVLCAGTSDLLVAEEAARTAEFVGANVERRYDVGVAGLHRLLAAGPLIRRADALVVAAGMEGALPSVVGGLASAPVIAVPTSVGYGVSYKGIAALLAMMNACAPGISVVNIDNGFGAGYLAAIIARRTGGKR